MAALERLRELHPDRFRADHLRTVQRFMKVRRLTMAREVLLGPLPLPMATVPGVMDVADAAWAKGDTKSPSNITSCYEATRRMGFACRLTAAVATVEQLEGMCLPGQRGK